MQEKKEKKESGPLEESNKERVIDGILKLLDDSKYSFKLPKELNWLEELLVLIWNSYGHYTKGEVEKSVDTLEYITSVQVSKETFFLVKTPQENPQSLSYFLASLINIGSAIRNKILFEKTNNEDYNINFKNFLEKAAMYAKFSKNEESITVIAKYRGLLNEQKEL